MYMYNVHNDSLDNFGNKTAKKLQFVHSVNGDGSKTTKIFKKVILLSITLKFRRCLLIFVVFDLSPLTRWMNCSF